MLYWNNFYVSGAVKFYVLFINWSIKNCTLQRRHNHNNKSVSGVVGLVTAC